MQTEINVKTESPIYFDNTRLNVMVIQILEILI